MSARLELGLSMHSQTVLVQRRDSGGISVFISLPQVSVLLECTPEQAEKFAAALLEVAHQGGADDCA